MISIIISWIDGFPRVTPFSYGSLQVGADARRMPLVLIAVRPRRDTATHATHAASQLEAAQHELKENGPERCLTRAQDENLIEPMRLQA